MASSALERVSHARSTLILDHPWFGVLSLRLKLVETDKVETAAVDGTHYYFNPEFINGLNDTELVGLTAHEVMHCALRHMYRQGGRDHKQWNKACDYAINPLLVQTGFTLPKDGLLDPAYTGKSAEAIYSLLEQQRQGGSGDEQPDDAPNSLGEFVEPKDEQAGDGSPAEAGGDPEPAMGETDWELAVEQATAVAQKAGHASDELVRAVQRNRPSTVDWREVLRRFVQQALPQDYAWNTPSRRHLHGGVYLPGMVKESMPVLGVAVDTSASISQADLEVFASELNAILVDCRPESVIVLYCDSAVKAEQVFSPDDEVTLDKLTPKGGGGTQFQPVFNRIAESGEQVAALIYFTDLDCFDKPVEPDYPTLWITPEAVTRVSPFGETVRLTRY